MTNALHSLRTRFTDVGGSLGTAVKNHRGMFAIKKAASTEDEVHIGLLDASSVMQWRRVLTKTYADTLYTNMTFTIGPYYLNDIPGTATTQMMREFFDTSTATSIIVRDPRLGKSGKIVGISIAATSSRTAGTLIARVNVAGVDTEFNADSVQLNATDTLRDADVVAHDSGVAFGATDTIGVNIVTSSWTPITSNLQAFMVVSLDAF